jgi:hypothetical protein
VLLDNSASPLQQVLETTKLANAPSPLCGLEESMRELTFVCGVEGTEANQVDAIEQLILDTLQSVADNGIPYEQVAAVLHQLELHQREVGGDGLPYGLQLIMAAMGNATHRGDPIAVLDIDPVLEQLHQAIKDPEYIKGLTRELLLNNQHRVTLVMTPDEQLAKRRELAEAERLAAIKTTLNDDEKARIIEQTQALLARQAQQDDESILPKVGLDDVPVDIHVVNGKPTTAGALPLTSYSAGTNGLVYQQVVIELPKLSEDQLALLPYYTNSLTELGLGEQDYLQTQQRQAAVCGSINAFTTMRGDINDEQHISSYLVLSSKALARNLAEQAQLMYDSLHQVRFDELDRIRDLINQQRARREQSVTNNGHSLAMTAACSGMSPYAKLNHELSGLAGIQTIKTLSASLKDEASLQQLANQLSELHQLITSGYKQLLVVAEEDKQGDCQAALTDLWRNSDNSQPAPLTLAKVRERKRQLWLANTQVNFCAKAYPTVTVEHPDAAALTVLGGFLRNGFLHRAIREQGGAYGGGASQDSNIAAFRFYSYRDPRMAETLDDFDAALNWLQNNEHQQEQLEQAILGVIGGLDKPSSPAGEAKQDFHNGLFGRSPEQRRQFRQRVLAVTLDDLKRVGRQYLKPEQASIAVISHQGNQQACDELIKAQQLERISL